MPLQEPASRLWVEVDSTEGETRVWRFAGRYRLVDVTDEYVPREVAERLAEALDEAADVIGTWAGHNHSKYHDALRVYDEYRAGYPKAEEGG